MSHRPIPTPGSPPPNTAVRPGGDRRARRRRTAAPAVLIAAVALLTGCGGSGHAATSPSSSARSHANAPLPVRLPVPDGFTTTSGWSTAAGPETPDPQPGSSGFPLVAVAPHSGLVLVAAADGSRLQAFSLTSGTLVWTFRPQALTNVQPGVFVQTAPDGNEEILFARQGQTSGSGLSQSAPTVTVDVIPANSHGTATAAHHIALPVPADSPVSFATTDTGFLVGTTNNGTDSQATVIDAATGTTRAATTQNLTVPDCGASSCTVAASPAFATSAGVVSAFQQTSGCDQWGTGSGAPCTTGFQVGTAWTSTAVAPSGKHTGIPVAATGHYLVAAWHTSDTQTDPPSLSSAQPTEFTVQDLATGKILAHVSCTSADQLTLQPGSAQSSTLTSPNGRYLISGQVAFDLTTGTGHCYTSTATTKGIDLTAVGNDGTAYGIIHTTDSTQANTLYGRLPIVQDAADQPQRPGARVDLATGTATALDPAAQVPSYLAADGSALFRTSNVLAVYPHS